MSETVDVLGESPARGRHQQLHQQQLSNQDLLFNMPIRHGNAATDAA